MFEEPSVEEFRVEHAAESTESSPGMPGSEAEDMPVDEGPSEAAAGLAEDIREAELYLAEEDEDFVEEDDHADTRILEPIPAPGEIKVTATHWLDEVDEERGHSLEWPAAEERDLQHRERIDTPRVRHLFPVPDSDWEVSHLEFEHYGKHAH